MTHEQKISVIRERCIAANPEIIELKFGCEIFRKGAQKREFFVGEFADEMSIVSIDDMGAWLPIIIPKPPVSQVYKIIGRPIRLADVELAMQEAVTRFYGTLVDNLNNAHWNLHADSLEEQQKETIEWLYEILK